MKTVKAFIFDLSCDWLKKKRMPLTKNKPNGQQTYHEDVSTTLRFERLPKGIRHLLGSGHYSITWEKDPIYHKEIRKRANVYKVSLTLISLPSQPYFISIIQT